LLNILIYLQDKTGYPEPIYHRDIKPDNILLDDQLKVYLIDFGLAKMGNREVNNSSIFAGTPIFIAPEQFLRKKLTKASDLYGLARKNGRARRGKTLSKCSRSIRSIETTLLNSLSNSPA